VLPALGYVFFSSSTLGNQVYSPPLDACPACSLPIQVSY
jgi:hypothetical protein